MKKEPALFSRFLLATLFATAFTIIELVVVTFLSPAQLGVVYTAPASLSDERCLVGYSDDGQPVLGQLVPVGDDSVSLAFFDLEGQRIDTFPWFAIDMPADPSPSALWRDRVVEWGGMTFNGESTGPWYMVAGDAGDAYFVEYSRLRGEPTRYLGTAGASEMPVPPGEYFHNVHSIGCHWPHTQVLLNCGRQLYLVDVVKANTQTLLADLKSPLRGSVDEHGFRRSFALASTLAVPRDMSYRLHTDHFNLASSEIKDDGRSMPGEVILCNDEMLYAMNFADGFAEGQFTTKTYPLPAAIAGRGFNFALRPEGGLTVAIPEPRKPGTGTVAEEIYLVDADGKTGPPRSVELPASRPKAEQRDESVSRQGLVFASPLIQAVGSVGGRFWYKEARAKGLWAVVRQILWRERGNLFWAGLLGAVLATICYRRQRHYCQPLRERIVWPAFVLLLGLPGWIGYRYCRQWPPLEECPDCHEFSPRDREHCAVCDYDFPEPVERGTEIFA